LAFDEGSKYFQGTVKKEILGGDNSKLLYPTVMLLDPVAKLSGHKPGHDTAKAVAMAVELENLSSRSRQQRRPRQGISEVAQSFDEFFDQLSDPAIAKALADDIAMRGWLK
jgi:hypothetical protein